MTNPTHTPGELKACPFCGADERRIGQATMRADYLTIYSVECYDCGAEIADDESQEAADRHWNTRTVDTEPLEALKAVLSELEHKGCDGWMTGCVHGDDYDRLSALLTRVKGDDHGTD